MAIKVGNDPAARPQSGLNQADIVFEEPIEGAITRLLAIYQCHGAPAVGPVRSTRWIDAQLLPQFGHPGFAFAGGIIPDEQLIRSSGVFDLNFTHYYGLYRRISSRVAPENLYASTAALWGADKSRVLPRPIFSYSASTTLGRPSGGANLAFSGIADVAWHWDASAGVWVRYDNGAIDYEADGRPVLASNVVIERVNTYPGPIPEDSQGALGVRSVTVGAGAATVLRNGREIPARWSRANIHQPTRISTPSGAPISLNPGSTWVELLPRNASLSFFPAG